MWLLVLKASTPQSPFVFAEEEHWCRRLDGEKEIDGLSPGKVVAA